MENIEEYLVKLPYWGKTSDEEKRRIRGCAVLRSYAKGALIHSESSECLGMVTVLRGEVRAYIVSEEGREITLFRLHEGDPCVLSASCVISQITFETNMTAEQDTELLIIGSSVFGQLAEDNIYVRCFMFELMAERFSSVMWAMQQILFKGFDRRLAAFLVSEYDRTGKNELRMTHEQIAQHTSSAREVVARMLKRFASEGLVEVTRGSIRLADTEALRKLL